MKSAKNLSNIMNKIQQKLWKKLQINENWLKAKKKYVSLIFPYYFVVNSEENWSKIKKTYWKIIENWPIMRKSCKKTIKNYKKKCWKLGKTGEIFIKKGKKSQKIVNKSQKNVENLWKID